MNEVSPSRSRTLMEHAVIGRPVIDRFGMTWWFLPDLKGFAAGLDFGHARRNAKSGVLTFRLLKDTCGPLCAGQVPS